MKIIKSLDLLDPPIGTVLGNHAMYVPALGIKLPFQFGGQICKRTQPGEHRYPLDTIAHEIAIMRALAAENMAPPIGDHVFVEEVISDFPGAWHCDPLGTHGYEMVDARQLPPGGFSLDRMRAMPIIGSAGAWNDIRVLGRANVVNGYLVDVRRSVWDMLRWVGDDLPKLPGLSQDLDQLRARVHRECQFPAGERAEAYQDFWIAGTLERGQRRVLERARSLGFGPMPGESVLDVGCQAGGFLQYAAASGATPIGVELEQRYVDCARALARSCGQNICIRQMDVVRERDAFLAWVRAYFPNGVDHCLFLSMEKHLGEGFLFDLIDAIGARRTYIETNAVAADVGSGTEPAAPLKLWPEIAARRGSHVGNSRDRNLRRLYRIAQTAQGGP
jgi:SAM-dependent methyltransferase